MTYRNKVILQAAKDAPICFLCHGANDGTVVAAHSNQIRDGKGTGHKAADYRIAYLCHGCHTLLDNDKALTKANRIFNWEVAHRESIGWLFESGRIKC